MVAFVRSTTGEKYTSCGCLQMGMIKAATSNHHNSESNQHISVIFSSLYWEFNSAEIGVKYVTML